MHDTCSVAQTPWKTYLTNEEFPFLIDPDLRSGWVWDIDPARGTQKRLTGMGGVNQVWVLPRGETGAENLELFAALPNRFEPTGLLERQQHPLPLGASRPAVPEQGDRDPAGGRELQPAVRPLERFDATTEGPPPPALRLSRPFPAPPLRQRRAAGREP